VARLFADRAGRVPGGTEWWEITNTEFDLAGVAARYARYADLTIVGQHDEEDPRVPGDFAEQLLLESGRPVLVIPSSGTFLDVGGRVVIAWDGSREAARAVNDALPLLAGATVAKVAVVRRARDRLNREDGAGPSILRHLARHGVEAQYEPMVVDSRPNGPDALGALLNLGADLGADLVVMGGRGKYGTPFPRAKRRTRASLAAMTAPVLLSM
jgi:nucleotide-binding universal stress UspA family protein